MNTLKSKLIKLIMTGLLVLTAFAFIACGGNQAPEDNSENNSEDDVETVSGTESIGKTQAQAEAAIEALVIMKYAVNIQILMAMKLANLPGLQVPKAILSGQVQMDQVQHIRQ